MWRKAWSGSRTRRCCFWRVGSARYCPGDVLGRDMRAALGCMGFLSGPLKPPRPFLALVYRVDFKLGPGSFTGLPLAIRCRCCGSCRKRCVWLRWAVPRPGAKYSELVRRRMRVWCLSGGGESFSGCTVPGPGRWFSIGFDSPKRTLDLCQRGTV